MTNLLDILMGIFLILLLTTLFPLFHIEVVMPNIAIIMTVHAGLQRDAFSTIITALFVGLFAATLSGGLGGPYLFALLPVIFFTRWAKFQLHLLTIAGSAGWVFVMSIIFDIMFSLILVVFFAGIPVLRNLLHTTPINAFVTGIMAFMTYHALAIIEPMLQARNERIGGVIR